jgi:ComEC/Rec2-related protein
VALLAGLVVGGLRWSRASPWTQAAVTATTIGLYALFVGADVPVVRAAIMASAVLAGRALELDADPANLLGLAALALLAHRPAAAADVGFQLSFGATLGILALAGPLTRGVPRMPLRLDLAIAASVAAQCALAPVLAGWFHRLAPGAVLLNIAAVPLSGAVRSRGRGAGHGAPGADPRRSRATSQDGGPRAPPIGRPQSSRTWLDLVAAPTFPAALTASLGLLYRSRRVPASACCSRATWPSSRGVSRGPRTGGSTWPSSTWARETAFSCAPRPGAACWSMRGDRGIPASTPERDAWPRSCGAGACIVSTRWS